MCWWDDHSNLDPRYEGVAHMKRFGRYRYPDSKVVYHKWTSERRDKKHV